MGIHQSSILTRKMENNPTTQIRVGVWSGIRSKKKEKKICEWHNGVTRFTNSYGTFSHLNISCIPYATNQSGVRIYLWIWQASFISFWWMFWWSFCIFGIKVNNNSKREVQNYYETMVVSPHEKSRKCEKNYGNTLFSMLEI